MSRPTLTRALLLALAAALVAAPAQAGAALPGAQISSAKTKLIKPVRYSDTQTLKYTYGPIQIVPGQNNIEFKPNDLKPTVPGYITRFKPDLIYSASKKIPRVDIIHLHHGVWLARGYPTFAAGEEKTTMQMPRGYGYRYGANDNWTMNYMIHNLTAKPTKVSITYELDFVPASSPSASSITEAKPLWMDVSGLSAYPVFDAYKGQGRKGKFTFPDQAKGAQKDDIGFMAEWSASSDVTLLNTAGHLHPGGLYTDLKATRAGKTRTLFRSEAKYFEPAGAVSWDVSMTHTKPGWRVALKAGDRLNVSATYDTRKASWYESMGIMVLFVAEGTRPGAKDPFKTDVNKPGLLTHGHLAENDFHGGKPRPSLPDARDLPSGPFSSDLDIYGYVYERGDLSLKGKKRLPPRVRAGQAITFKNLDATASISPRNSAYHTITACKAPCTATTGIAYPLADAAVQFDSGELGFGGPPAAGTNIWTTPKSLKKGTYTYFCRIHPSMRGAFRVVGKG